MNKKLLYLLCILLCLAVVFCGCGMIGQFVGEQILEAVQQNGETAEETAAGEQADDIAQFTVSGDGDHYSLYKRFIDEVLIPEYGVATEYAVDGGENGLIAARIHELNNDNVPELLVYINRTGSSTDDAFYVDALQMYAIDGAGEVELRQQHEYYPSLPEGCQFGFYIAIWEHEGRSYVVFTDSRSITAPLMSATKTCLIYEMGFDAGLDAEAGETKLRLPLAASAVENDHPPGYAVGFPDAPAALQEQTGEYSVYYYKDYQELYGADFGKRERIDNIGIYDDINEAAAAFNEDMAQLYGFSFNEMNVCAADNSLDGELRNRGAVLLYSVDVAGKEISGDMMDLPGRAAEVSAGANKYGNTVANIMNGGSMTWQGNDVYFLLEHYGAEITHGTLDEVTYQFLEKADAFYMNVIGDWLYFACDDIHYLGVGPPDGIYKMRTDGSDLTQLRAGFCHMLYAVDDRLYALLDYDEGAAWDLHVEVMDLDGGYITDYDGIEQPEFALYDGDIFFWKKGEGICRMDTDSGNITPIIKPDLVWFRIIEDKIFYVMESGNIKSAHMCDMDGSNSVCVMPTSANWTLAGLIMRDQTLHCDGSYVYFYGTTGSYSHTDSQLYIYDPRTGKVIDPPIPSGSSFSIAGDWISSVDENYAAATRKSKAELGLTATEPYWDLSATAKTVEAAGQTYSATPVIRNAQIIYDMVELNIGGADGELYLTARIKEASEYRQKLREAYEKIKFNDKVLAIEDLSISATLTVGSICTANAAGAAAGISAATDGVIGSAGGLLEAGLNEVIDGACLSANDFVFCMTQMANTGTFALFANLHIATDRDNMTEQQAAEYIISFYGAKMDMQTQLMGYLYFNEQLPAGFLEKLETSLNTAFFALGGFVFDQYVPSSGAVSDAVSQQLAKSMVKLFAGESTELYETVSLLNNDIITEWGQEMRVLQKALNEALAE